MQGMRESRFGGMRCVQAGRFHSEKPFAFCFAPVYIFPYGGGPRGKGPPLACWIAALYRPAGDGVLCQLHSTWCFYSGGEFSLVNTPSLGRPLPCSPKGLLKSNLNLMWGTMDKHFILHFTPSSMIPPKSTTPNVPLQPDEIVDQVLEAVEWGIKEPASMINIL